MVYLISRGMYEIYSKLKYDQPVKDCIIHLRILLEGAFIVLLLTIRLYRAELYRISRLFCIVGNLTIDLK